MEEFLQAGEVVVGDADGLFVGQPLGHVLLIGIATLEGALASNKDKFHIIALGYLGT